MAADFYGCAVGWNPRRCDARPTRWQWILLLVVLFHSGWTQNPATVEILGLEVYRDTLFCRLAAKHLLDQPVEKTLLSGLPVKMKIQLKVLHAKKNLNGPQLRFQLHYDIWENRFTVRSSTATVAFTHLDSLRQWWRNRPVAVLAVQQFPWPENWHLLVQSQVILLASATDGGFQEWLQAGQPVEENEPSQDRNTGFKLNLNDLIGLFLKKDQVLERFQDQQKFGPFSLSHFAGSWKGKQDQHLDESEP